MLKRILCGLLAACAIVTFASCGKKKDKKATETTDTEVTTVAVDTEADETSDTAAVTELKKNEVTAAPKETKEPATTPENYTVVECDNEFKQNQVRFNEVSVAKIGGSYVINAIYSTIQSGIYYARLVDHSDLFDTTGNIEQNAQGSAVQLDLPVSAAEAYPDGKIEIGFILPTQADMADYIVYLNVADIIANAKVIDITEVELPMDITLARTSDYVRNCKATFDGTTYHFSFEYNITDNCKFNRTYPVNEDSIVITNDPTGLSDDKETDISELGKNDVSINGQGIFHFDIPAEELKNDIVVAFRIYLDGDFMSATIGTVHIESLGRLTVAK